MKLGNGRRHWEYHNVNPSQTHHSRYLGRGVTTNAMKQPVAKATTAPTRRAATPDIVSCSRIIRPRSIPMNCGTIPCRAIMTPSTRRILGVLDLGANRISTRPIATRIEPVTCVDGNRYWLSTRLTVNRIADERAQRWDNEEVREQLRRRLRLEARQPGEFARVQACPGSPNDVADEPDVQIVILGPESPYDPKDTSSPAKAAAQAILDRGGSGPQCANALVFLAPDRARLGELEIAVRQFLAWQSIEKDPVGLNLDEFQKSQAEKRRKTAEDSVVQRIPEAYMWLLVPEQLDPRGASSWSEMKVQGSNGLAGRASKMLISKGLLAVTWGGSLLRMDIDKVPLWRGDHVSVKELAEDFARYVYLTRLKNTDVLLTAIADGASLLNWDIEGFAYADCYDEVAGRYRGLREARDGRPTVSITGVVVKPEIAAAQFGREKAAAASAAEGGSKLSPKDGPPVVAPPPPATSVMRRFYGSTALDHMRMSRDASRIADEIVQHLAGLVDAKVEVRLELRAESTSGVPGKVVRTVTENCRTLKFDAAEFE